MKPSTYPNLESILDIDWLTNNPDRLYNQWIRKSDNSKEKLLLSSYDKYLERVIPLLTTTKKIQDKIRNQFVETYNELDVGCSLVDRGFDVDFECTLIGNITPDIFIKKDNVIVEVKTLHQSDKVERGIKSHGVYEHNEANRIRNLLFIDLEKYAKQEIMEPLIIVICPDIIKPPYESPDDFKTVLDYQINKMFVLGPYHAMSNKVEYKGLYYNEEGEVISILSGVGHWYHEKKEMDYYPNPKVRKTSKIPQGELLDFLNKCSF